MIKNLIYFILIIFLFSPIKAEEIKFKFFGIELGEKLNDESVLTGSDYFLHYQNEVGEEFIPKIKNEDFAKYWLVRGPLSNKVFKINAQSYYQISQANCLNSRDEYVSHLKEKYKFTDIYERTNIPVRPVLLSKNINEKDELSISISCHPEGNYLHINFTFNYDEFNLEINNKRKKIDKTGL